MDEASNALWKAAEETLDTRKTRMGKRETHPEIKTILDERQNAVNEFNQQEIRRLTNKLKKKSKQIGAKRIIDSLEEGKWDPVKLEKRRFLPQHVRIRNEDGRIVNDREKADTFAEFYENKQWKCEGGARGTRNKQNSAERNTRH